MISCEVGLLIWAHIRFIQDFPGGSDSKESTCNAGDPDSILRLGRSPGGEGMAVSPVFLPGESPWTDEPTVHGVAKESDMTEQLSHFFFQGSYKRVDEV